MPLATVVLLCCFHVALPHSVFAFTAWPAYPLPCPGGWLCCLVGYVPACYMCTIFRCIYIYIGMRACVYLCSICLPCCCDRVSRMWYSTDRPVGICFASLAAYLPASCMYCWCFTANAAPLLARGAVGSALGAVCLPALRCARCLLLCQG